MKAIVSCVALTAALLVGLTAPASASKVIELNPVGGAHERGRAVLTDVPAAAPVVRVQITVFGEPAGAVQPSHIHKGVCGSNGPILKPLHSVVNGTSVTMIPGVTVAQLVAQGTYINVHKAPNALPIIVTCGKI